MTNLDSFTFTNGPDLAVELLEERGPAIFNDVLVETLDGDDTIIGEAEQTGILNNRTINMGDGNDFIRGQAGSFDFFGSPIRNNGTINMGDGNDSIIGEITPEQPSPGVGIRNNGTIDTGQGDDLVRGVGAGTSGGIGIINNLRIATGDGDDSIEGIGGNGGIGIRNNRTISTGDGNDLINGDAESIGIDNNGIIDTGEGNDSIIGSARDSDSRIFNNGIINTGKGNDSISEGINNSGRVEMGEGNDSIIGEIFNDGVIEMGDGNDVITSFESEFTGFVDGVGLIDLGAGDDLIRNFGNQIVDGEAGFDMAQFNFDSDQIEVSIISDNFLKLAKSSPSDEEMTFTNVELFEFNDFSLSFDELRTLSQIDFDEGNLAAGTVIIDQFEDITISTPSEFGVMIFDTNNPTGGDDDLGASVGNALIISEDGDSSDPDDNAAGGTISIEFDQLATVTKIGLLDIEESGGSINLFDNESNLIEVIEIEPLGDGRLQQLALNVQEVARMDINLAGSGALTELNFFEASNDSGIINTSN